MNDSFANTYDLSAGWLWRKSGNIETARLSLPGGARMTFVVERLPHWPDENRSVFTYGSAQSTGFDLIAALETPDARRALWQGEMMKVPLGFRIVNAEVFYGDSTFLEGQSPPQWTVDFQIRPRSGMAINHGITLINSPGTIDVDYKDEVCALLYRTPTSQLPQKLTPYVIKTGDKVAQGVLSMALRPGNHAAPQAKREGGFGSTGV